jgi:hypothetical protein
LLKVDLDARTSRIPGLGDLPYLGPFFSNTTHTRMEKELLILVTPYLVQPMEQDQVGLLPGEDIIDPTDCEFYLQNRIEGRGRQPLGARGYEVVDGPTPAPTSSYPLNYGPGALPGPREPAPPPAAPRPAPTLLGAMSPGAAPPQSSGRSGSSPQAGRSARRHYDADVKPARAQGEPPPVERIADARSRRAVLPTSPSPQPAKSKKDAPTTRRGFFGPIGLSE